MGRIVGNKWFKYTQMKQDASLVPYLPEMRQFSKEALRQMIDKYGYAIVKPASGSRGRGVIQVAALQHGGYELHYENQTMIINSFERMYDSIRNFAGSTPYLVQRRVSRATVDGRPFDLRIVVQRRKDSDHWTVTGKLAKVAGEGYIVSNITRSKGTVLPLNAAIRKSTIERKEGVVDKVEHVAYLAAYNLGELYPRHRIFGLDVGLDRKGHVWIIEANLYPSLSHFRKLGNNMMIRRILSFKKS